MYEVQYCISRGAVSSSSTRGTRWRRCCSSVCTTCARRASAWRACSGARRRSRSCAPRRTSSTAASSCPSSPRSPPARRPTRSTTRTCTSPPPSSRRAHRLSHYTTTAIAGISGESFTVAMCFHVNYSRVICANSLSHCSLSSFTPTLSALMVYLLHLSTLHISAVHYFCVVLGKKPEDKFQAAQSVIERLPEDNYEVLKFLVEFLVEVYPTQSTVY